MQFFEGRLKNITFSWSSQRSILNDRTDESIFFSFPTGNIRFLDLLSTKKKKKSTFFNRMFVFISPGRWLYLTVNYKKRKDENSFDLNLAKLPN